MKNLMKNTGYNCIKTKACKYCGSILLGPEPHGWCCNNGKTPDVLRAERPEFFDQIDNALVPLYTSNIKEFEQCARKYNKMFCFSSMGATGIGGFDTYKNHRVNGGNVSVNGRTYHRIFHCNDSTHRANSNPMKWYLIDPEDRERSAESKSLDMNIYKTFDNYITSHNDIAKEIKRIPFDDYEEYSCGLKYNSNCNEIGSFILDNARHIEPRHIIYSRVNDTRPIQISTLTGFYEPLQYPLLFPKANFGWDVSLRQDHKLSQMHYYRYTCAYRLQVVPNHNPPSLNEMLIDTTDTSARLTDLNCHFTSTNRLFSEYFVDMYSRMVDERVQFWKSDHVQGRIASYREYDQAVSSNMDTSDIGRVHLPAGVNGSLRKSRMQVNNAMKLVDVYGKASFFITLTTNPNWPDIQRHLLRNQTAYDRPDIVNRVFKIKLAGIMTNIRSGKYFGGYQRQYEIKVIEYQIRGLPHAHIAIKYDYPDDHDLFQYVSAVVPPISDSSTDKDKAIHHIICQSNIHMNDGTLCSLNRDKDYCCRKPTNTQCSKHFPKKMSSTSYFDDRGYPVYIRNHAEDLFVVPYNGDLSYDWDGHANVEICSSTTCIAYLYKYVFKGPPRTSVHTHQHGSLVDNEIDDFITGRYLSASEAHWHFCGYRMYSVYPTVKPVSTHMPGEETVIIDEETGDVTPVISQLNHYYARPKLQIFNDLTLTNFYDLFIVSKNKPPTSRRSRAIWQNSYGHYIYPRSRGIQHTRLFTLLPYVGEKYYLQMILRSTPAHSTHELYHHNGSDFTTLRDAALSRNLFSAVCL